jgi:translation initiation factor IF-2
MRVYELAKELELSSKDLIGILKDAGFAVGSHMSVLSEQGIAAARKASKPGSAPVKQATAPAPKPVVEQKAPASKTPVPAAQSAPVQRQPSVPSASHQTDKTYSSQQVKKVDMTDSSKTIRSTSEAPKAPFQKSAPHHVPDSKPRHHEVAKASIDAERFSERPASNLMLDEQVMEKLGTAPLPTNAKGQEKFTRIFSEKRRPTNRKRRRRNSYNQPEQVAAPKVVTEFEITGPIRVGDLAAALGKPVSDVILNLLKRGMACNINHVVQPDMAKTLTEHYGIKANMAARHVSTEEGDKQTQAMRVQKGTTEGLYRRPIVVVMGHVDHGKTTLLDYIRQKNVAGSEKGGITQHLGAYEVTAKQGKIIFLDTPGHEAFSYIRRQGSKVTDIAILVIAADDGIKPQTIEAIKHAKDAGVPIIVAINKVDKVKSPAAIETIKRQLASQYDLMTEDWGGQVICVSISGKTGEGVDNLLDMVVLQAQMMDLKARTDVPAKVFVLESHVEKGFGPVATGIVLEGVLKQGDFFVCGKATGKIRLLIDSQGKRLTQAEPSVPVKIVGFNEQKDIGEWLSVTTPQEYAKIKDRTEDVDVQQNVTPQAADFLQQFNNAAIPGAKHQRALNLIIKTDTRGSKEALSGLIEKLAKENKEINCPIRVIMSGIGDISESDVELAMNTEAYLIGLHVKAEKNAQHLARDKNVSIHQYDIIYHLIEYLQTELNKRREIKVVWEKAAELVVRKVFDIKGLGVIAGCYVREGVVARGDKVICMRAGKAVGEGKVNSLQRDKKTVKEVHTGFECGFICDAYTEWVEDDIVQVMREVKLEKK